MDIKNVKKQKNKKIRTIAIRIDEELFNWLNSNRISKTKLFMEACKELGYEAKE